MFPRNPSKIFRSRWSALFWAGGVILFAVMTIGFGDNSAQSPDQNNSEQAQLTEVTGSSVSNADLAVLKKFIDGK